VDHAFIALRFVDPAIGAILGKSGKVSESFEVRPVTGAKDLEQFEQDFRHGVTAMAQKALEKLGLL